MIDAPDYGIGRARPPTQEARDFRPTIGSRGSNRSFGFECLPNRIEYRTIATRRRDFPEHANLSEDFQFARGYGISRRDRHEAPPYNLASLGIWRVGRFDKWR